MRTASAAAGRVPEWPAEYTQAAYDFSGYAAGTHLESIAGWTRTGGAAGSARVSSNGLAHYAAGGDSLYTYETGSPIHFMEAELFAQDSTTFTLGIRVVDASNMIRARLTAANGIQVYKYVAGTPTLLFQEAASVGIFRLETSRDGLWRLLRNGQVRASGVIDSALQAGTKVGFVARINNGSLKIHGHFKIGTGAQIRGHSSGGWCWFHEPRAVSAGGKTFFGCNRIGATSTTGAAQVASIDEVTGEVATYNVASGADWHDDHSYPVLLIRPDGRLIAFYSKHNDTDGLRFRISVNAYDVSAWSAETVFTDPQTSWGNTYPSPCMLSAESNKVYVFFRDEDDNLAVITSTDIATVGAATEEGGALADTVTWASPSVLVENPDSEAKGIYAKVWSNGVDRIDFGLTYALQAGDGTKIDIRHAFWKDSALRDSDGVVLGAADVAFDNCTLVADSDSYGDVWVHDICRDRRTGVVQIVFAQFVTTASHRYHYARFGSSWSVSELPLTTTYMVPAIYTERYYSPGACLDGSRVGVVYAAAGDDVGASVMYRLTTMDGGANWLVQVLSPDPISEAAYANQNVRPVVPRNRSADFGVLWMRGSYTTYFVYGTDIVSAPAA